MKTLNLKIRQALLGHILLGVVTTSPICIVSDIAFASPQEPTAPAPNEPAPTEPATSDTATGEATPSEAATAAADGAVETNSEGQTQVATDDKTENNTEGKTESTDATTAGAEVDSASELGLIESTDGGPQPASELSSSPPDKATGSDSEQPAKELNVPPKDMVPLYEKDRPEWLFKSPTVEDGKLVIFVGGELCSTEEECQKKQPDAMYTEVCHYFDAAVFHTYTASMRTPLSGAFIAARWSDPKENYLAKVQTSEGTMYQLWSIVRIDDEGIKTMKEWHLATIQPYRIRSLGFGLVGILSAVSLIHLGARFTARRAKKKS